MTRHPGNTPIRTPVVILHPTDLAMLSVQPIVVGAALRQAGFNVEIKSLDWQTLVNQRENRKSVAESGWSLFSTKSILVISGNPINNITLAAAGHQSWLGWPDVPAMERLRERFVNANSLAERKALAAQMQQLAIDEVIVAPLGQFHIPSAYRSNITDVLESPMVVFWNLKKSDH